MVSIDSLTCPSAPMWLSRMSISVSPMARSLVIVGPTVCGKSTILNAIAGFLKPAGGIVSIDGQPVRGIQKDIGYLF